MASNRDGSENYENDDAFYDDNQENLMIQNNLNLLALLNQSSQSQQPPNSFLVWKQQRQLLQLEQQQELEQQQSAQQQQVINKIKTQISIQHHDEEEKCSTSTCDVTDITADERRSILSQQQDQEADNSEFDISEMIIEEVRKYPSIWDISSKAHKDKFKKMEAWRRVSSAVKLPGVYFKEVYKYVELRTPQMAAFEQTYTIYTIYTCTFYTHVRTHIHD